MDQTEQVGQSYCGYVALVGRPNVGKSTLMNRLIGQKVSITARKPQTTRHRILGIQTQGDRQFIYVDTPGLHFNEKSALNTYMNRAARSVFSEVDVIVLVLGDLYWHEENEKILHFLKGNTSPVVVAINKIDKVKDKKLLLPFIEELTQKYAFHSIFPISAKQGTNVLQMEKLIKDLLPAGPHLYEQDQLTDRNTSFLLSELIREQLIRLTGQELPYAVSVEIEKIELVKDVYHIYGLIWVERSGQKAIFIGAGGEKLKEIGRLARLNMEKLLGKRVFLKLWIKVKPNWFNDKRLLHQWGYDD